MTDPQFSRWQAQGIAQLSVALALISGLSVAALGFGHSSIQADELRELLTTRGRGLLWLSMFAFLGAVLCSCSAVITRALDFRLTARNVRSRRVQNYAKPLTIFWLNSDGYGRLSWFLFWAACVSFVVGVAFMANALGDAYASLLF